MVELVAIVGVTVVVTATAVVGVTDSSGSSGSSDSTDVVGLGDAVAGLVVSSVVEDGEFPQAAAKSRKARRTVNFRIALAY